MSGYFKRRFKNEIITFRNRSNPGRAQRIENRKLGFPFLRPTTRLYRTAPLLGRLAYPRLRGSRYNAKPPGMKEILKLPETT
jgi:hypothetical protein